MIPVHFELKGVPISNNSIIRVQDLGRDEDALLGITPHADCCRTLRAGEFRYQNGDLVGRDSDNQPFYRNRGTNEVRLHRRNSVVDGEAASLLGRFSCELPDGCGDPAVLYITIGKLTS